MKISFKKFISATPISMTKNYFLLAFTWLVLCASANAQTTWEWDSHGVGFETPHGFSITTNNHEEFEAENDNVFVSISAWQDESITEDHLADFLIEFAVELEYDVISELSEIVHGDLVGFGADGTKDGTNVLIATFLDTKSGTNLIVVIGYQHGYDDTAADILASIYPYD